MIAALPLSHTIALALLIIGTAFVVGFALSKQNTP